VADELALLGSGDALAEVGVTYRQLNYWVNRGWLRPVQAARSSGVPRRWPLLELEIAKRIERLAAAGVAVDRAAVFARESWPAGEIAPGIRIEISDAPFIGESVSDSAAVATIPGGRGGQDPALSPQRGQRELGATPPAPSRDPAPGVAGADEAAPSPTPLGDGAARTKARRP
jgi:hypothetical protein